MSHQVTRRQFLRGTAAGALGIAAGSLLQPGLVQAEAVAPEEISWDYEADVVVIGSGGAGLPAALKAMEDGASVIVVEAGWDVGGHCAVSGGNLHSGCGTEIQKKYGIEDSADQYYADHTQGETLATRYNDREYVRAVADSMAECYEFCIAKGLIIQDREPERRYYWKEGGTEPESVGRWTFTDAKTEGWSDNDYTGRGSAGIGITRPLERSLRKQGARFLLNYHMDKIYRENNNTGVVTGIMASYTPTILPGETEPLKNLWPEGNIQTTQPTVNIRATKGVIVATGGSIGNERFRTMFDPRLGPEFDGLSGMPFSDQDGSGELAAMAVGASLGTLAAYMQHGGHQITMANRFGCRYGYGGGYTEKSPIWKLVVANGITPDYDSLCVVNMLGERCGNEDKGAGGKYSYDSYEYFNTALSSVLVDPEGDGNAKRYGGPLWAIFDQDAVERNDWEMEQGVVDFDNGYCFKADTLEELAQLVVNKYYEEVKMDPQILVDTISRYNTFVDKGVDEDWGKKTLAHKIARGPFYAAWATPNLHDTYAGLRVNGDMQVVDLQGELIPGLFASGECSGGMRIHGLGRVMTSGYIAGRSAAAVGGTKTAAAEVAQFTGTSENGINGAIQLRIDVQDGMMTKIEVVKHAETESIGDVAFEPLIKQALETQSSKLDVISGATITSNAFMEALAKAMAKAGL